MSLSVTIPWKVHAKQRPRSGRNGVVYTPKATRDAEKIIADNFKAAVGDDWAPYDGPLKVDICLRDDALDITIVERKPHTHKRLRGDIDNYLKTVLDALNGVAWVDDVQIVSVRGVKG